MMKGHTSQNERPAHPFTWCRHGDRTTNDHEQPNHPTLFSHALLLLLLLSSSSKHSRTQGRKQRETLGSVRRFLLRDKLQTSNQTADDDEEEELQPATAAAVPNNTHTHQNRCEKRRKACGWGTRGTGNGCTWHFLMQFANVSRQHDRHTMRVGNKEN